MEFFVSEKEFNYDIDIYTREIVGLDYDANDDSEYGRLKDSSVIISREQAIEIVRSGVSGAKRKGMTDPGRQEVIGCVCWWQKMKKI